MIYQKYYYYMEILVHILNIFLQIGIKAFNEYTSKKSRNGMPIRIRNDNAKRDISIFIVFVTFKTHKK
jgi:hypothetical protein